MRHSPWTRPIHLLSVPRHSFVIRLSDFHITSPLAPVKVNLAAVVLISPAMALGHPLYPVLKSTFSTLRLLPPYIRQFGG